VSGNGAICPELLTIMKRLSSRSGYGGDQAEVILGETSAVQQESALLQAAHDGGLRRGAAAQTSDFGQAHRGAV